MVPMIGVFDSGFGGLTVLSQIRREMPDADLTYFADQARAPYGVRSLDEVASMSIEVVDCLLERGATTIAVACNTASAAALHRLRDTYPEIPFVGMEPAVKPAVMETSTGVIGVLATSATFQGELFASLVQRHAGTVRVITQACPRWVELVEAGALDGPEVEAAVGECLKKVLDGDADTVVLGCTHFAFLSPVIRRVAGESVMILDPAPAIARQVRRIAPVATGQGRSILITSGDATRLESFSRVHAGITPTQPVLAWTWK
jgi:glutamate racemase